MNPEYATNCKGLSFRPTSEADFDEADGASGVVQDGAVIWCLKWNQGCFDVHGAVHVAGDALSKTEVCSEAAGGARKKEPPFASICFVNIGVREKVGPNRDLN